MRYYKMRITIGGWKRSYGERLLFFTCLALLAFNAEVFKTFVATEPQTDENLTFTFCLALIFTLFIFLHVTSFVQGKQVTWCLMFCMSTAVIGSLQFGYNTGVINAPDKVKVSSSDFRLFKKQHFISYFITHRLSLC